MFTLAIAKLTRVSTIAPMNDVQPWLSNWIEKQQRTTFSTMKINSLSHFWSNTVMTSTKAKHFGYMPGNTRNDDQSLRVGTVRHKDIC